MTEIPLRPGDRAPDVILPSAIDEGTISIAAAWRQAPVLLVLFRGIY